MVVTPLAMRWVDVADLAVVAQLVQRLVETNYAVVAPETHEQHHMQQI
jgi:hypothetical protein